VISMLRSPGTGSTGMVRLAISSRAERWKLDGVTGSWCLNVEKRWAMSQSDMGADSDSARRKWDGKTLKFWTC
jgi:hypothetical protein